MSQETVHIHRHSLSKDRNTVLLAIPIVIFFFVIAIYVFSQTSNNPKNYTATTNNAPVVLGTDSP